MPIPPTDNLLPEGVTEQDAVALLRHLEWQPDQFSLVFVFGDLNPVWSLTTWLQARLPDMRLLRVEAPKDFFEQSEAWLDQLLDQARQPQAGVRSLWWVVNQHPQDKLWDAARRRWLARLNERRFLLEQGCPSPVVVVLPTSLRSATPALLPDLWHIRSLSVTLKSLAREPASSVPPTSGRMSLGGGLAAMPDSVGDGGGDDAERLSLAWQRAWEKESAQAGAAYLPLSVDASEALLEQGRVADAQRVVLQALDVARARVSQNDSPQALRDLSISLEKVGGVAEQQGAWDRAQAVYEESLALSRELVQRLGGSPQALRDLSISLEKVGGVAKQQGAWDRAQAVYEESLALRRELVQRLGGSPQALRDLSISLNKVGDVAEQQGAWDRAQAVYEESLALSRELVQRLGGSPQAQLDLVEACACAAGPWLGVEARRQGLDEAQAIYAELLEKFPVWVLLAPVSALLERRFQQLKA